MDYKFLSALIGAIVVGIGWIVTDLLFRRRAEENRRKENTLSHIESQIKDMYGPLLGLIEYSEDIYNVSKRLLPGKLNDNRKDDFPPFSDSDAQTWEFFVESYFIPIHQNVRRLISSNTHLLEKNEPPMSFRNFLNYAADLECRHKLYLERKIDTSSFPAAEYPIDIKNDIQEILLRLSDVRSSLLGEKRDHGYKANALGRQHYT